MRFTDPTGMGEEDENWWSNFVSIFNNKCPLDPTDQQTTQNNSVNLEGNLKVANDIGAAANQGGKILVDGTKEISKNISKAGTAGAIAGVAITVVGATTGQPEVVAAGAYITNASLATSTVADGVGLAAEAINYSVYDGSSGELQGRAIQFGFSAMAGTLTKPLQVVSRTVFTMGPIFRGSTGYVSNLSGGAQFCEQDATRIIGQSVVPLTVNKILFSE
jgi:hypothetical protein